MGYKDRWELESLVDQRSRSGYRDQREGVQRGEKEEQGLLSRLFPPEILLQGSPWHVPDF